MRFSELLATADVPLKQRKGNAEVTCICEDSRRCGVGCCFVAVRGSCDDGHRYIASAVSAGGVAVVCEDTSAVPDGVAVAVVDDTRRALGRLAQAIYGWPARNLLNIGVTGTNGKTTVSHLVHAILTAAGHRPALLGTICYQTGGRNVPAGNTTPDPVSLAEMTAEMVAAGRTHLVMEVSSHALHQRRTAGITFDVAVFMKLSGDHLDYHGTMENYFSAKRRLFKQLKQDATAVINRDDPAGESFASAAAVKPLWYGLSPAADLRARIERIDVSGTRFTLIHGRRELPVSTPLIGRHNVFNCLAAAGTCLALDVDLPEIAAALETVERIPGRLERLKVDAPYRVFVDYAHTDDALANVLGSFRPITSGRIIVVFGCGGDRDRTKRPRMGRIAEELADHIIITSDNPRTEEPGAIIDEIVAGLSEDGRRRSEIQVDRRAAIGLAINLARAGDVVLIAGKGHENYQVVGTRRIHFDDVETAAELVRLREGLQ